MDVQTALAALTAGFAVLLVAVIALAVRMGSRAAAPRPAAEKAPREAAPQPAAEAGIPEEVVAAIAAAVCCLEPGACVRSVRRAKRQDSRSTWKTAGLLENTRPF